MGWSSLNKNYKKFVKTGSEFTQNSEALSKYMYDGEIIEEFVDAMNDVIGDTDVTDMSDHVAKAVSQMSTDHRITLSQTCCSKLLALNCLRKNPL